MLDPAPGPGFFRGGGTMTKPPIPPLHGAARFPADRPSRRSRRTEQAALRSRPLSTASRALRNAERSGPLGPYETAYEVEIGYADGRAIVQP
jgi:hypothetical protein